jgi:hypothetical protein
MGTFRHRTAAKPPLGGLLKPLFRQFQDEVRKIQLPGTLVNKDKRKRLRYIPSTQLLPKDIQKAGACGVHITVISSERPAP